MNASFEQTDAVNGVITVEIKREDFENDVKKEVKTMGVRRPIKGFRPGHAPASLLMKYYGPYATSQVVDRMVSRALAQHISDNKLHVLGEPLLNEDTKVDLMDQSKDEFTFKFDVGLRPEFEIKLNKRINVPYYNIEVTDAMVDEAIAHDRKRLGKLVDGETATEDAMLRGSLAELDADGNEKEDGIKVERTVISPSYFVNKDEAAKFNGVKVGDKVVYNPHAATNGNVADLSSMLNVDRNDAANIKSDFAFTVIEIKVNEDAELNQEFFDNLMGKDKVHNEQELRDEVRKQLGIAYTPDSNRRFTVDAERALLKAAGEMPLPEEFLKRFVKMNREENDKHEPTDEEYQVMFKDLRWQLVRDNLLEQLNITVNDEEVEQVAMAYAQQQMASYGMYQVPEEYLKNYAKRILEDDRSRESCHMSALDNKLFAAVKEAVKVNEKTITAEDFNKLYEDDAKAK